MSKESSLFYYFCFHFLLFSLLRFQRGIFKLKIHFQGFPEQLAVHLTMQGRGDGVLGYLIAGNEFMVHLFGVLLFALRPKFSK